MQKGFPGADYRGRIHPNRRDAQPKPNAGQRRMRVEKSMLIIGGSGFVGSHLVPAALAAHYRVTVLNRGNCPQRSKNVIQLIADRNDDAQMVTAARNSTSFDVVIDTSSYNWRHSRLAWSTFSEKTSHWIHLSSAAVYQEESRCPSEDQKIGGASVWGDYGIEKSEAEEFLVGQSTNCPVTILRPPYLYGSGNDNDRETFIWSRCLQGRPVVVPGSGKTEIQFLHIDDLAACFLSVANVRPTTVDIFNVAGDERISLTDWVRLAAEVGGFADPGVIAGDEAVGFMPRQYFPFRDYPCCVEVRFIKEKLGWRARLDLRSGLEATLASYTTDYLIACSKVSAAEETIAARIAQRPRKET